MLLPPKVVGPISEASTSVAVLGAVSGATVQLLANGSPIAFSRRHLRHNRIGWS